MPPTAAEQSAYGVSAGLDLLSGVFGYLTSLQNASIAGSQADMIRQEAEYNAQAYEEKAAEYEGRQEVFYQASGVTGAGSPADAIATTARVANNNVAAILMQGNQQALNMETEAVNQENQGRAALTGGLDKAVRTGFSPYLALGKPAPDVIASGDSQ